MKIITLLVVALISTLASAQKVQMVFNANGVPEEMTLVDDNGVRIGYSNIYNASGILVMALNYSNGVPNGVWSRYDDKTGKIRESFTYVNGKLNGERFWYDESGAIIRSVVYQNGLRINTHADSFWALEVTPDFKSGTQLTDYKFNPETA